MTDRRSDVAKVKYDVVEFKYALCLDVVECQYESVLCLAPARFGY